MVDAAIGCAIFWQFLLSENFALKNPRQLRRGSLDLGGNKSTRDSD
jgi:hypothetical protein